MAGVLAKAAGHPIVEERPLERRTERSDIRALGKTLRNGSVRRYYSVRGFDSTKTKTSPTVVGLVFLLVMSHYLKASLTRKV